MVGVELFCDVVFAIKKTWLTIITGRNCCMDIVDINYGDIAMVIILRLYYGITR